MERQVINKIECAKCHKEFDVATEDIEWEHLTDAGEKDDNSGIHDYYVVQKVSCPYCDKLNNIVFVAQGKSEAHLDTMEVVLLEITK